MGTEGLAYQFLKSVPNAMWFVRNRMRRHVASELTISQFRILAHLQKGPLSNRQLAEIQGVSVAAMSRMVQTMVEHGFLLRKSSKSDRREVCVSLTPKGIKYFEAIKIKACKELELLMGKLSTDEKGALSRGFAVIEKIINIEGK